MILVLDNRDSFTHNLAQTLLGLGAEVEVIASTDVSAEAALRIEAAGILLGPGPGRPGRAGCSEALVRAALASKDAPPLFGVCLGHQAIATALGGRLRRAATLVHGETRPVLHDGTTPWSGMSSPAHIARYNSLVVDDEYLPSELNVTARTDDGDVAGIIHRNGRVFGIQGHPESVLCVDRGRSIFEVFLALVGEHAR